MEHEHTINSENEQKTFVVIILTLITMVGEILYGYMTHSMALLADGCHMATHAFALSLTFLAYILIRKFEHSKYFPNGTTKIGVLSAYTSSIFLALTGVWIIIEAIHRIYNPLNINFNDAIIVAIIGFVVNIICIVVMDCKSHKLKKNIICNYVCSSEFEKKNENVNSDNCMDDYNFKAAYYHILADVMTSILAIFALIIGKFMGIIILDVFVGIIGGCLILKWAAGLLKNTIKILIDMN